MFDVHAIMIAIVLMTLWPVLGVVRYSRLLGEALELACVPQIKDRAMDHYFQKNWVMCVQHRQLIALYYPFVVVVMLCNTLVLWFMYNHEEAVHAGYLLAYCALVAAYGYTGYLFQSHPTWLVKWINQLKITRATLNLEQVNQHITKKQIELYNAQLASDTEKVADIEREIRHLVGLGDLYTSEIDQLEKPL